MDTDQLTSLGFEQLVEPQLVHVRRFAATLVSPADVDDLVQDSLTNAWRKHASFDAGRGSLRTWLLAIVADQARQRWRRRSPAMPRLDLVDLTPPERDSSASIDLRRAIAALPHRQRQLVILHYYVALPIAEVAVVAGCSVGSVKSGLFDARRSLAQVLGAEYGPD